MARDEDCRTAVFGKTERTVGREGDGELVTEVLVRHCTEETCSKQIGAI